MKKTLSSLLFTIIVRLFTLICLNNNIILIRLFKPGVRLNNIVYEILILLTKEILLSFKNSWINNLKVNFFKFADKFLFMVLNSNKVSLPEQIIEVFEILIIKNILNFKYINFILAGSIYCILNSINNLETNLFIYITIIIYLVYFYNVILKYRKLNSTFLGSNWFKLILTGLIIVCFLLVFLEILDLINSLCNIIIGKLIYWTKGFFDPVKDALRRSSGGASGGPSGGPGGPGGPGGYNPSAAGAGSRNNQNSNNEDTRSYDPVRDISRQEESSGGSSGGPRGYDPSAPAGGSSNNTSHTNDSSTGNSRGYVHNKLNYECTVDKIIETSKNHPLGSKDVELNFAEHGHNFDKDFMEETKRVRTQITRDFNALYLENEKNPRIIELLQKREENFQNFIYESKIDGKNRRVFPDELKSNEWNQTKSNYLTGIYQQYLWCANLKSRYNKS